MVNVLKFSTSPSIFFGINFAFYANCLFKIRSGMVTIVDPDQTAPSGALGLYYLHMPFCQKLWCTKF